MEQTIRELLHDKAEAYKSFVDQIGDSDIEEYDLSVFEDELLLSLYAAICFWTGQ